MDGCELRCGFLFCSRNPDVQRVFMSCKDLHILTCVEWFMPL
jgi:hypothetical protein